MLQFNHTEAVENLLVIFVLFVTVLYWSTPWFLMFLGDRNIISLWMRRQMVLKSCIFESGIRDEKKEGQMDQEEERKEKALFYCFWTLIGWEACGHMDHPGSGSPDRQGCSDREAGSLLCCWKDLTVTEQPWSQRGWVSVDRCPQAEET